MVEGKDKKIQIKKVEIPQDFFNQIQEEVSEKIEPSVKKLREWRADSMKDRKRIGIAA